MTSLFVNRNGSPAVPGDYEASKTEKKKREADKVAEKKDGDGSNEKKEKKFWASGRTKRNDFQV